MGEIAAKITDSELEVMEVLWQAGEPLPLQPIRTQLERTRGWDGSTVKTLLRRLCEKGAVEAEKRAAFYYRPLLSREECKATFCSGFAAGLLLVQEDRALGEKQTLSQ